MNPAITGEKKKTNVTLHTNIVGGDVECPANDVLAHFITENYVPQLMSVSQRSFKTGEPNFGALLSSLLFECETAHN